MNDLAQMIADMHDDDAPALPDKTAQRVELVDRFARLQELHTFTPGQLVSEKEGLAPLNLYGEALIFLRYLDCEGDWRDREVVKSMCQNGSTGGGLPDCRVGFREEGGASIKDVPCDSARLRPLTAEEQAELDRVNGSAS